MSVVVEFTEEEFAALYAAFSNAERINWKAYDAARERVLNLGGQVPPNPRLVFSRREPGEVR